MSDWIGNNVGRFVRRCGSSPERAFAWALFRRARAEADPSIEYDAAIDVVRIYVGDAECLVTAQPESPDGSGRHDFRIVVGRTNLVIEIDDPSHLQKDKAASDRRRDRENLTQGVFTVRFGNDESERSVDRCVAETLEIVEALVRLHDEDRLMERGSRAELDAEYYSEEAPLDFQWLEDMAAMNEWRDKQRGSAA